MWHSGNVRRTALAVVFMFLLSVAAAGAEEKINLKGKIKDYDLDAKTVLVASDEGKEMSFTIENEKALQKLDDRLFKGDEVKIRYTVKDGKNVIRENSDMKGTKPGC